MDWYVERITQIKLSTDIKRGHYILLRSDSHYSTDSMILFIKHLYLYVYRKMHVRVYTKLYILQFGKYYLGLWAIGSGRQKNLKVCFYLVTFKLLYILHLIVYTYTFTTSISCFNKTTNR